MHRREDLVAAERFTPILHYHVSVRLENWNDLSATASRHSGKSADFKHHLTGRLRQNSDCVDTDEDRMAVRLAHKLSRVTGTATSATHAVGPSSGVAILPARVCTARPDGCRASTARRSRNRTWSVGP